MKVLDLIKIEKKCTEVAKTYSKNKSSCGIVKEKEEIQASFAVALQTTKDIATVHGEKELARLHLSLAHLLPRPPLSSCNHQGEPAAGQQTHSPPLSYGEGRGGGMQAQGW